MTTDYLKIKIQEDLVFEAFNVLDDQNPGDYHPPYKILETLGKSDINHKSIYSILERLEARGLVQVTKGLVRLTNQREESFN